MTATKKLPVWATVFAAWRYLATQWRIVLPLAAFLLLLIGPASVFWPAVLSPIIRPFSTTPYFQLFLENVLSELPFFALAAIALVPLHRAILTGPPQPGMRVTFRLGRREAWYFLFVAAFAGAGAGLELTMLRGMDWSIAAFLNLVLKAEQTSPALDWLLVSGKSILFLVAIAAFIYFSNRLSLALPATATDRREPLSHAWTISTGNGWRVVAVLFIVILPLMVVAAVFILSNETMFRQIPVMTDNGILVFVYEDHSLSSVLFRFVWDTLAYTAVFLIGGAALSMSYRALGGMKEDEA